MIIMIYISLHIKHMIMMMINIMIIFIIIFIITTTTTIITNTTISAWLVLVYNLAALQIKSRQIANCYISLLFIATFSKSFSIPSFRKLHPSREWEVRVQTWVWGKPFINIFSSLIFSNRLEIPPIQSIHFNMIQHHSSEDNFFQPLFSWVLTGGNTDVYFDSWINL